MAMIANLQYGWTLFVNPIDAEVPLGPRRDPGRVHHLRRSPRPGWCRSRAISSTASARSSVVLVGGMLVAHRLGHQLVSPTRCAMLYVAAAIGGVGAGAVYGTCVGNALKWFPDRRGLAAGLTAAGFGAGSALTIMPIANMIADERLRGGLPLVRPRPGHHRRARSACCCARRDRRRGSGARRTVQQTRRDYSPAEMLAEPVVLGHVRDVRAWSAPAA